MRTALLADVHRVFEEAGVGYAFMGRTAATLWGEGAAEREGEVEVLARLEPGDADDLLACAEAAGMGVDSGLAGLAVESGEHLTLFPHGEGFVDVQPARGLHDMAALRTRVAVEVGGRRLWVTPLEETIARLLDEGTEEAVDAAARLRAAYRAELDEGFLGQRCEELGVLHLLREIAGEPTAPSA